MNNLEYMKKKIKNDKHLLKLVSFMYINHENDVWCKYSKFKFILKCFTHLKIEEMENLWKKTLPLRKVYKTESLYNKRATKLFC